MYIVFCFKIMYRVVETEIISLFLLYPKKEIFADTFCISHEFIFPYQPFPNILHKQIFADANICNYFYSFAIKNKKF